MLNTVQFFDEFQKRVNELYNSKFIIDEAMASANKRPDGDLDKQRLYLNLLSVHDRVRNMQFHHILDKNFIASAHARDPLDPLRPFYNIYSRLMMVSEKSVLDYLASHLVLNVANPILTYDKQGAPLELNHAAVLEPNDLAKLTQDVTTELKKFPHVAFLYALSLCETHFPSGLPINHDSQ